MLRYFQGSILATSAVYACHKYLGDRGNLDWRIPLWLQMICPGMFTFVAFFLPESPRWYVHVPECSVVEHRSFINPRLIAQDRHEEAKAFFATYHANGDADHPLVTLQMAEALEALYSEPPPTWKDLFDLRVLFESRASRYRIMLNMTFSWFGQFSGNK